MVEGLAAAISRPWGVGFSDYCLLTGDVPVLVLNGQDDADQASAVRFWDVYLPMDPHRCLYLPGLGSAAESAIRRDHRFKLHGGLALGLNSMMIDTAKRYAFDPEHDPTPKAEPAVVTNGQQLPQYLMHYKLPPGHGSNGGGVETHPESSTPDESHDERDPAVLAQRMLGELGRRRERFGASDAD